MTTRPRSVRYGPYFSMLSVGYVLFAYASIPSVITQRFDVSLVSVGLLMSAALVSFTLIQIPGSRIVDRTSTLPLLFGATVIEALLAVSLDLTSSFETVLLLRGAWGLAAGLIVTTGATHYSRLYSGSRAARHQGVFGGMVTLGGAIAFFATSRIVARTGWFGIHATGALAAVPAAVLLWRGLRDPAAASLVAPPAEDGGESMATRRARSGSGLISSIDGVVLVAALCYVATLSGYITLSTFITAYFEDLGVVGPLNVAVLLTATLGRAGGGVVAGEWSFEDRPVIVGLTGLAAVGFVLLSTTSGAVLLVLPLVIMIAVSGPYGAIFNVASSASVSEGRALSVVVALGNVASLALPTLTGVIRETTGSYDGAFLLFAGLHAAAALSTAVVLRRR